MNVYKFGCVFKEVLIESFWRLGIVMLLIAMCYTERYFKVVYPTPNDINGVDKIIITSQDNAIQFNSTQIMVKY